MSINKYRIFCITENQYVYRWNNSSILTCPNNNTHTINTNTITIIETISQNDVNVTNSSQDEILGISEFIKKTVIFDIKSFYGVSNLRDTVSGNVTLDTSELQLQVSNTNDLCSIQTKRRGQYVAGYSSEIGIGLRLPNLLIGTQEIKFGYFDQFNGYYFRVTSNDFIVGILDSGTSLEFSQNEFNLDKLDGTGTSKYTLDLSKGNIFRIIFAWYGYGSIVFSIIGLNKHINIHRITKIGSTSTRNPHLPINVSLKNNSENTTQTLFLGGRSYSILGEYSSQKRQSFYYYYLFNLSYTTLTPIFSIKKQDSFISCNVYLDSITIKSNYDCFIQIINNSTLTGNNFITNNLTTESCVDVDVSATSFGGIVVWSGLITANDSTTINLTTFNILLIENFPLSVVGKSLPAFNATVTVTMGYIEEW